MERFESSEIFMKYLNTPATDSQPGLLLFKRHNVIEKESLLIVEKVSLIGKLLKRQFQNKFSVTLVESGSNALEKLMEKHYDVVLISLDVDDKEGLHVIQSFFKMSSYVSCLHHHPELKTNVIAMTRDQTSTIQREALAQGFSAVLVKPFTIEDLRKAIGERVRLLSSLGHILPMVERRKSPELMSLMHPRGGASARSHAEDSKKFSSRYRQHRLDHLI